MHDLDNQAYNLLLLTMVMAFSFLLTLIGALVLAYLQHRWIVNEFEPKKPQKVKRSFWRRLYNPQQQKPW